ncbi:MYPU_1760 family metalloprotease [Mesomycoplasma molare]|uniref:Lipoprotein n=1 Tax=Mesomycoplasma molare TaxID=171288 RepID=A0ABY5TU28_9BACT|nr:hypothetical protein [Mesomycoplasma molare]UWD34172.1 hypothetical protein NX772_03760 [Mesomycoplasma molare]
MKKKYFLLLFLSLSGFFLSTSCNIQNINYKVNEYIKHKTEFGFNIIQYNKNNAFFLDKNDLNLLEKRVKESLFFGSEIQFLNNIIIDRQLNNFNNKNLSAFFVSNTKEIFINSDRFKNLKNNNDKIEAIFQLIFHEYFHFIDSVYISNYDKGYKIENKIYNKDFVEKFLDSLNLKNNDFQSFVLDSSFVDKNNIFNFIKPESLYMKKINNEILDDKINDKNLLTKNSIKHGLQTFPSDANYYFSLEERIAIDAFRHFYIEKPNNIPIILRLFFSECSPFANIEKKDNILNLEKVFVNNTAFEVDIQAKDQKIKTKNKTQDFFNNYLKIMNYGLNISSFFTKNNQTFLNNKIEGQEESEELFISGYTKEIYNSLVFKNISGDLELLNLEYTNFSNLKSHKNINDQEYNIFPEFFYSYKTNKTLNIDEINLDYEPKLWKDINKNGKIEEELELFKLNNFESNLGPSSYRSYLASINKKNFLEIRNKKITKGKDAI